MGHRARLTLAVIPGRALLLLTASLAMWMGATGTPSAHSLFAEVGTARVDAATTMARHVYDLGTQHARTLRASATSSAAVKPGATENGPGSTRAAILRASRSAAEDVTTVGRWMSSKELQEMQSTGRVVEGGGGRTYVTRPADPDAYPAGKGVFAEFDVPSKSVFPAAKPEWGVIPGPNAGTFRYGPLPFEMPRATCISVVCTR